MAEPRIFEQPAADAAAGAWLPPLAALAQFEPPEGMHLAAAGDAPQETQIRYGFRVGTLGLLVPIEAGSEVLDLPPIASIPATPAGFLGLINLRGNLVPLYELRTLLHLDPRKGGTAPLALVFGKGDLAVGVLIDGFPVALSTLREVPHLPPIPDALQDHVHAAYLKDDDVWLEFNHGSFFDEVSRGIKLDTA
jgi:twitching motility protein PilI